MSIPIILLSYFFYYLAAADCVVESHGKNLMIKENAKVSLTSSGKSLQDLTIQDQDSLGTCYANAASTMLKSVLDKHPDISYLHASIKTAGSNGKDPYIGPEGKLFVDDNNICSAVLSLKNNGGYCPKKYSLPENQETINPEIQAELFRGLGKYFDHLNKLKDNPGEKQKLLKEVASIVSALKTEKDKYKAACIKRKSEEIPISRAIGSILGYTVIVGGSSSQCDNQVRKAIRKIATPESIIEDYKTDIDITKDFTKGLVTKIQADKELSEGIKRYLQDSKKANQETKKILGDKLNAMIDSYLQEKIPNKSFTACSDNTSKTSLLVAGGLDPDSTLYNLQAAKNENCEEFIAVEDIKYTDSYLRRIVMHNSNEGSCSVSSNQDEIMNAIIPLLQVGVAIDEKLQTTLTDPNSQYAHQIEQALMPGCLKKENLVGLNDIKCGMTLMCSTNIPDELKNMIKYDGQPNTCLDGKKSQKLFRSKVFDSISKGIAPGISMCTGVLVNPSVDTEYCTKPAPGIPKHTFHALPITGYRCLKGQIQYEMVNSWGSRGCPVKEGNKNSAIECQQDKYGNKTGTFWINELALVKNSKVIFELGKTNP
jgi:hypothetical protein